MVVGAVARDECGDGLGNDLLGRKEPRENVDEVGMDGSAGVRIYRCKRLRGSSPQADAVGFEL